MSQKLMRSPQSKIIAGVCGGLGEYFDVDPVFVRIIAVIFAFASGFGVLAYIVAWVIMPQREFDPANETLQPESKPEKHSSWNRYLPGMILIAIGTVLLVRQYGYWFDWGEFWAVAFIVAGLYFIFRWRGKNNEPVDMNVNAQNNNTNSENGGHI
jgi:phage shock protein C